MSTINDSPSHPVDDSNWPLDDSHWDEKVSAYLLGEEELLSPKDREAIRKKIEDSGDDAKLISRTAEAVKVASPQASQLEGDRKVALMDAARDGLNEEPANSSKSTGNQVWMWRIAAAAAFILAAVVWPLTWNDSEPMNLADQNSGGGEELAEKDRTEIAALVPANPSATDGMQRLGDATDLRLDEYETLLSRSVAPPVRELATITANSQILGERLLYGEERASDATSFALGLVEAKSSRKQGLAKESKSLERTRRPMPTPSSAHNVTKTVRARGTAAGSYGFSAGRKNVDSYGVTVQSGAVNESLDQEKLSPGSGASLKTEPSSAKGDYGKIVADKAKKAPARGLTRDGLVMAFGGVDERGLADASLEGFDSSLARRLSQEETMARRAAPGRAPPSRNEAKPSTRPERLAALRPAPTPSAAADTARVELRSLEVASESESPKVAKSRSVHETQFVRTDTLAVTSAGSSRGGFGGKRTSGDAGVDQSVTADDVAHDGLASSGRGSGGLGSGGNALGAAAAKADGEEEAAAAISPEAVKELREQARADLVRERVETILTQLDRKPGESPSMMFFRYWGDNPFVTVKDDPKSTFSIDVDTASYTLMRNYLFKNSNLPPKKAIRTEEFLNYFDSKYPAPEDGKTFSIHTEVATTPYLQSADYRILKVGIKAKEVSREKRKACALVFVIDTSGSMKQGRRLELVKDALRLLVPELDEGDTVGIVAFDRDARKILDPTPASEQATILAAIDDLHPRSNTNVDAGLRMGYEMAAAHMLPKDNNRVILLSDGVANTGSTRVQTMIQNIATQRDKGIYLTTIGVGMGNHNDALLERLADTGDGQCVYVDRIEAARKVFVENLTGTLETVARNVKIQMVFDPSRVQRFRLLGYENRALTHQQFRDNKVDAGEVGAGHEVVALYEIKLHKTGENQKPEAPLARVHVRYQEVDTKETIEVEHDVEASSFRPSFEAASTRFQLSVLVSEFAEILRDSYWARGSDLGEVAKRTEALLASGTSDLNQDEDAVELVALMKKADALVKLRNAAEDQKDRIVDAIKENMHLKAQIEDALAQKSQDDRRNLEDLRGANTELRSRLERLLGR